MQETELVIMGYVSGAFGVRGWIKIHADTEYADSLFGYKTWWLGKPGQAWQPYAFGEGAVQSKNIVAQLTGVDDRDQAFALRGLSIAVPRSELPPAADDEYYWADLIGLTVINQQDESLGEIIEMMETGAHDIIVVRGAGGQHLIPFVQPILIEVDLAARRVRVDWQADYLR